MLMYELARSWGSSSQSRTVRYRAESWAGSKSAGWATSMALSKTGGRFAVSVSVTGSGTETRWRSGSWGDSEWSSS